MNQKQKRARLAKFRYEDLSRHARLEQKRLDMLEAKLAAERHQAELIWAAAEALRLERLAIVEKQAEIQFERSLAGIPHGSGDAW